MLGQSAQIILKKHHFLTQNTTHSTTRNAAMYQLHPTTSGFFVPIETSVNVKL